MGIIEILFERYSLGFFIHLTIMMLIFLRGFEKRSRFYARFFGALIVALVISYFLPDEEYLGFLKPFFLVTFLSVCVFFCFCFKIPFKHSLFYCSAMYAIQNLCYHLYAIGCIHLNFEVFTPDVYIIVNYALSFLLSFLIYYVVVRNKKMILDVKLENKAFVGIVVFILFVVFGLNSISGLADWSNKEFMLVHFFLATCCVLALIVFFGNLEQNNLRHEQQIMEQLLRVQHQQHELSKENIELINIKCHDIKHQISKLKTEGDTRDRSKMIAEMEKAVMIYDSSAKTGNDALDVVLTEKSLYCEKYNVRLAYMVDGAKLSFMSQPDVYSLFGNALDNAIESVMKVDDVEKRVVNIKVHAINQFLLIHMENYFDGRIDFEDGLPKTTKGDEDFHGFGMKSIRYVCNKYGGKVSITAENNMFNLDLVIPIKK